MKRKNTFLGVALLIAVLALGIGYALTSGPLKINGTATATESGTSFNVIFTDATPGTATATTSATAEVDADDATIAVMTVSLTNVGESQTATFEVTNNSQAGLKAVLSKENIHVYADEAGNSEYNSEYFTVTTNWDETGVEIASGQAANLVVTVTLDKAVLGDDVTENFYIVLDEFSAVAEN